MEQTVDALGDREAALAGDRRGFLKRGAAVAVGALVALVPGVAGLLVFLDPLFRRRGLEVKLVPVAGLAAVPADGIPRRFTLVAARRDAWNTHPSQPVGAVYLRRDPGSGALQALNALCPHAGCFVDYTESAGVFRCPCHGSRFEPNGGRIDPRRCPSPRGLDALTTEVRDDQIWVRFQDFRAGVTEKIPLE